MPVVSGGAEPRNVVGLLGPGSKTRLYTPVHQRPNDSAGCLGGQRWLHRGVLLQLFGVFDVTCHALLTDPLGNFDTVPGFAKHFTKKTPQNSKKTSYIYMKMQTILQFHNFSLDASWSTEC